jgi:hypothetical protein
MPRKIYDMLDLPPLEKCYYDVPTADVAKKKPLGSQGGNGYGYGRG